MVVGGIRDTEYGVWSMECLTWNLDAGWRIIYFQENSTHILFTVHYTLTRTYLHAKVRKASVSL